MNRRKYFNRVLCVMIAFVFTLSLLLSLVFYFDFIKGKTEKYENEKRVEMAYNARELSHIFQMSSVAARAVANYEKTEVAFAANSGFDEVLDCVYSIFGEGYVYIVDENGKVIKKSDSPSLSDFILEKAKSDADGDFVLNFVQKGTSYIAHTSSQQTVGGRKIFVIRAFETGYFLSQKSMTAQNFIIMTNEASVYADSENTSSEFKSFVNTVGIKEAFKKSEGGSVKGAEYFAMSTRLVYPQQAAVIFSYSNDYLEKIKFEAFMYAIVICVAIFALLAVACWFVALIIYHPIDELVAFSKQYSKEEKADDEIAYISNAFKAVEKNIEDLKAEAKKDHELLKIHFIKDLITGVLLEDDISPMLEKFEMTSFAAPFYVGILEISDCESLEEIFGEREIAEIKRQICNFINGELMGRSVYKAVELDNKRFAVITNGYDISKIRQNLSYIISVINGEFDIEMFAAIGSETESIFDINQSYVAAVKVFENSFAAGFRSSIVAAEDMEVSVGFYYPVNLERDLISSVLRLKKEESLRIINDILDENTIGKTLTKERHNALAFAFSATINRIIEALNKTTADIFGEDNIIFLELKMCSDAADFRAKIVKSFERIIEYMTGSDEADLSQRLLDYIHSHYNEDVSLNDIGNHFNLSQCYISTVFKEATGENFKDYLSRYRIKKAKEILTKNPSIKTKELAAMIGCNTVATLFRLFNKYEGMSPGQFVKSIKE